MKAKQLGRALLLACGGGAALPRTSASTDSELAVQPAAPFNVLYVVVDDLTSNLKLFGGDIDQTVTPNFERLAKRSVNFHRAYAQQAVCGPSRNSFLTGRYPDEIHVYTFTRSFRDSEPEAVPLPQLFKEQGYFTCGFGKTYHDDRLLSPPDYDQPYSWSDECPHYHPPQDYCGPGKHGWCTLPIPDDEYTDALGTTAAIERLCNRTRDVKDPFFFFMVGLRKPHMDWAVPQRFFDMQVPQEDIQLLPYERRLAPEGMPPLAWWNCSVEGPWYRSMSEVALYRDRPLQDDLEKEILRAYYAAVSFTDYQLGRLLDELDAQGLTDTTAIIFHSDHGYSLSEDGMHCKRHTMETGARVPLLISIPWLDIPPRDERSIVELVDVYPTLAELFGWQQEGQQGVHGRSLLPLLKGTADHDRTDRLGVTKDDVRALPQLSEGVAFSQYPRCLSHPSRPGLEDKGFLWNRECSLIDNDDIYAMGYSIRVAGLRYTEWYRFDNATWLPLWDRDHLLATELYRQDLSACNDLNSRQRNLVHDQDDDQQLLRTMKVLSDMLARHFGPLLRPRGGGACAAEGKGKEGGVGWTTPLYGEEG